MQVYARQLGFSTFIVGTIYTILPILGLISKPLFGALADRYEYIVSFIYIRIFTYSPSICISNSAFTIRYKHIVLCLLGRMCYQ